MEKGNNEAEMWHSKAVKMNGDCFLSDKIMNFVCLLVKGLQFKFETNTKKTSDKYYY